MVIGKTIPDLPNMDVSMDVARYVGLQDMALHAHRFAGRFHDVIVDREHRRFVSDGEREGFAMPDFEDLCVDVQGLRTITSAYNPTAGRVHMHCDEFMLVPLNTAIGFSLTHMQAATLRQAAVDALSASQYVQYHRFRAEVADSYRGPSAVPLWNAFSRSVEGVQDTVRHLNSVLSATAKRLTVIGGDSVSYRLHMGARPVSARVH